jgi:hypothetical protein
MTERDFNRGANSPSEEAADLPTLTRELDPAPHQRKGP